MLPVFHQMGEFPAAAARPSYESQAIYAYTWNSLSHALLSGTERNLLHGKKLNISNPKWEK